MDSYHHSDSSSEDESSSGEDDWITLAPAAKLLPATLERMKQRKVIVNGTPYHYESPDGHLLLNRGDTIQDKCATDRFILHL